MKKLFILAIIAFGGFQAWENFRDVPLAPLYAESYVAVYGRNSCGFTQNMISNLKNEGLNYRYFIVDEQEVAYSLHQRMESSGISIRSYNLPVVDVNGRIMVRPDFQKVLNKYNL
ncbi:MAG: glutaredoxin [Cellvibrionaceae bacterium]|jgi:glutaredoxin